MDSIVQLFRLAYAGGGLTLVQAKRLNWFLIKCFSVAVVIVLVGWACNLAGWRGVSIGLSLVLTVLTIIVWFDPVRLALIAGAGAVAGAMPRTPGTATSVAEKFLLIYVDVLGKVLLWGSVLLFVLGTIPFGENPFVIFGLTAALLLIVFIDWQWKIGIGYGKKLFHWYVCVMIVLFIASLVPGPYWVKYMPYGWDPATIKPTATEESLYSLNRAKEESRDASRARELDRITAKVKRGEVLTAAEDRFVAESSRKMDATTQQVQQQKPIIHPASSPQSTWPLWVIQPGEKGVLRYEPRMIAGKHIVLAGRYVLHTMYQDGHECTSEEVCPAGPQVGFYVLNNTTDTMRIPYAFAPN